MKGEPSVPIFRKDIDIPPIFKDDIPPKFEDDSEKFLTEPDIPLPPSDFEDKAPKNKKDSDNSKLLEKRDSLMDEKEKAIREMLDAKLAELDNKREDISSDIQALDEREKELVAKESLLDNKENEILLRVEKLEKTEEDLRIIEDSMTKKYDKMVAFKKFISEEDDKIRSEIEDIENAKTLRKAIPKIRTTYTRIKNKMRRIEKEALGKFVILKDKEKELDHIERELKNFSSSLIAQEKKLRNEKAAFENLKGEAIFNLVKDGESFIPSHEVSPQENKVRELLDEARSMINVSDKVGARSKIDMAEKMYNKMDRNAVSDINYEIMELQTELKLVDL